MPAVRVITATVITYLVAVAAAVLAQLEQTHLDQLLETAVTELHLRFLAAA